MRTNNVFCVGECGTGKTLMGAVAAHSACKGNYRVLVVGPPHLTRRTAKEPSKWGREIIKTIPGAEVIHLDSHRQLLGLPDQLEALDKPAWVIASRNFLKMAPPTVPAFARKKIRVEYQNHQGDKWKETEECPHCPTCGSPIQDADGNPVTERWLTQGQRTCKGSIETPKGEEVPCGAKLWRYAWPNGRNAEPNFLPAPWMKARMRFDVGIFDEVHELKGGGSAQGQMLGSMAACCDKLLALTGTLFGGKASDLFYLMWRLCPDRMKALGFDYGSVERFVERYGIRQRVIERDEDVRGKRSKKRETAAVVEKPGIHPALFTDLLLDRAAFLSLDEMVPHLPKAVLPPRPRLETILCELGELEAPYRRFHDAIAAAIKESSRGQTPPNMGLISAMFNGLDCYPDYPMDWDIIYKKTKDEHTGETVLWPVCKPESMPDIDYDKDRKLVELVTAEVKAGRRCLVYTVHTIKHPVSERIERALTRAGVKCAILDGVDTNKREEWVEKQKRAGVQVIITHPAKVETGLDLLEWPTIIFHSMGTKPMTFRQAGARAWRLGQTRNCRIIIMAYRNTMQEMIATLMFAKMRASTRLEGQILEGLSSIGDGEDITDQILKAINHGETLELSGQFKADVRTTPMECQDDLSSIIGTLMGKTNDDPLAAALAALMAA